MRDGKTIKYQRSESWRKHNMERVRKNHNKWVTENIGLHKTMQRRHLDKLKLEVLSHYSPKLRCRCGFLDLDCLELDHIENNGAEDRKNRHVGPVMHRWLKKNNYPKGFQVLCKNCNWKKYIINLRKKLKEKYDR